MATLLARKASGSNPFASNDQSHDKLLADTNIDTTDFTQTASQPKPEPLTQQGNIMVTSSTQPVLTQSGNNAAQGADFVANDNSDWINKKWRPAMGWIYMMTCTMDFVIFPILWSLLQAYQGGSVTAQWQPLTLQGAGLYHIAMGAVLGIAAYGRTKEKVTGTT